MSSISPQQPDPSGSFSPENAPQVVVRAGKHYVCSACGTLVEIPAEVVGQMVLMPQQDSPAEEVPPPENDGQRSNTLPPPGFVDASTTTAAPKRTRSHSTQSKSISQPSRPALPKRPKRPPAVHYVGQSMDGLIVPSAQQLGRALAWVSFHLKVLDRQGSELQRLKKVQKRRCRRNRQTPKKHPLPRHAHADEGMAPKPESMPKRGPP
ncbi:hypothetical protein AB1K70_24635 [Bremerella sp. JC770]|uniref:hypothetical protein n=1 Tax=Bremerella sp. JC770 TaxID=3232137 RepID=UPI003457C448